MTPSELLLQDVRLRAEADQLLRRHEILHLLSRAGRPHVSGSYALELMTWRDLDIYLEMNEVSVDAFVDLGCALAKSLAPRKASFTDHLHYLTTERVTGLYWGIHTDVLARGGWKIDLWGVSPAACAERLQHCERIAERLVADARLAILAIKNEVCRHPRYRDTVTSQHVYDAVLENGVRTLEGFWQHMTAAGWR